MQINIDAVVLRRTAGGARLAPRSDPRSGRDTDAQLASAHPSRRQEENPPRVFEVWEAGKKVMGGPGGLQVAPGYPRTIVIKGQGWKDKTLSRERDGA